jgi:hypothetical protein
VRVLPSNKKLTGILTDKYRTDPRVAMMQNMFAQPVQNHPITHSPTPESPQEDEVLTSHDQFHSFEEQVSFHSDLSSDEECHSDKPISDKEQPPEAEVNVGDGKGFGGFGQVDEVKENRVCGGGLWGLQACRTYAIEFHLRLVVKNRHPFTDASKMAAESNGFAWKWGGRQVHS